MKRKIILALMTICILSFVSCGKQEATATTESIPNAVESAQVETTETTTETIESTEVVEDNTSEAEAKDESTEAEKTTEVTNIEEAEPLSEKDLAFSFLGYDTYNEYVEAGNDEAAYMLADNANMIVSGEFTDDGNVIESPVRGIKLGDSIDKVIELLNSHPSFPFCKRVSHFESDLQILYPTFHFCNDFPVFFLAFMI